MRRGTRYLLFICSILLFLFLQFPHSQKEEPAANGENFGEFLEDILMETGTYRHQRPCEEIDDNRYGLLKELKLQILLAGNTYNSAKILPTQIRSILRLITYLPNTRFGVSVHESGSSDKTATLLDQVLRRILVFIGVEEEQIYITTDRVRPDWKHKDRIEILANLRNQAASLLWTQKKRTYDFVLFFNDVFFCGRDLLELILQHVRQEANITCAVDWRTEDRFYDLWVARDITGNYLTPTIHDAIDIPDWDRRFPPNKWLWEGAPGNLIFINHPPSRRRYDARVPTQVYTCWNGVIILDALPFLKGIRFRGNTRASCQDGEANRICKDFWMNNATRVQIVPSVNVAYEIKDFYKVRGKNRKREDVEEEIEKITWDNVGPKKSRCVNRLYEFWRNDWVDVHN